MCSVVDWSEMNPELVDLIMKRLDLLEFIRAGAVCRLWWSTMNACTDISALKSHTPWLILSSPNQPEYRYVSNPAGTKSLYKFHLPNIKHHFIIGSSNGFIISVDEIAQIHATNPVTGSHRLLPAITTLYGCVGAIRDPATNQISSYLFRFAPILSVKRARELFYNKIAIFSTSSSAGLISVVIHNSYDELAFARESDESWTSIKSPVIDFHLPNMMNFNDVLFYKGLLYAVTSKGDLVAFDILNFSASSIPVIHVEGWSTRHHSSCGKKYLVQSPCGSDLFLVARYRVEDDDHDHPLLQTVDFKIYKLNQDIHQWSEVSSFGTDHAVVFLGFNQSVMLLAKDIPTIAVNKGDFIYFTDDSLTSRWQKRKIVDMGIFCMEDKKIIPLDVSAEHHQQFSFPPPFWFTPVINK